MWTMWNIMRNLLPKRILLSGGSSLLSILLVGNSLHANLVVNPGFQFTTGGHTNGDSGHAVVPNGVNTSPWRPSGLAPLVSDPQLSNFNLTTEYLHIQTSSPGVGQDVYQQLTIPSTGTYTLTMDAVRRITGVNTNGSLFLQLWLGNLTTFTVGSPISPSSSSSPALTANVQQYSRTYTSLPAGSYTLRVGGTFGGGTLFQAGIDNIDLSAVAAVPESSAFLSVGLIAAGAWTFKRLRRA